MVIPVPAPIGGALVVGESAIAYMGGQDRSLKVTQITPTIMRVRRRDPDPWSTGAGLAYGHYHFSAQHDYPVNPA